MCYEIKPGMNLAERCFCMKNTEDQLFDELEKIIGDGSVNDCWFDYYDDSVEVIMRQGSLNRNIADKILELGFCKVYESPNGILWTEGAMCKVTPREGNENRQKLENLRKENNLLKKEIQSLKQELYNKANDIDLR